MEPQSSAAQELRGPGGASYTFSQTARACLQALQFAAWIEAMILAYRAAHPEGAGSWLWFVARCILLSFAAVVVIGVLTQIAKRRSARDWVTTSQGREESQEPAGPDLRLIFDVRAFESTAGALLFHFGTPLWMWIFA